MTRALLGSTSRRAIIAGIAGLAATPAFAGRLTLLGAGGATGAAAAPGASATTISAANIPTGARVYHYHPNTATLVTATRADGKTGVTSMRDVDGAATGILTGGAGTNQAPELETDPVGIQRLVFNGGQMMEMLDAVSFISNRMAVFVVAKPTLITTQNPIVSIGITGASPPVNHEVLNINSNATVSDVKQRAPRVSNRHTMDGNDATYSVNKERVIVGEQLQCIWGVSRATAEPVMATGSRYTRGGINNNGVNGISTVGLTATKDSFTFGKDPTASNFLKAFVYEIVIVAYTATTEMTFTQAQAIAAELVTNWAIPEIDTAIISSGDSRIAGDLIAANNPAYMIGPRATYPDGPLPKNVRHVTFGVAGTLLSQAVTNRDTNLLFSTYKLQGGSDVNIVSLFWSHNDVGGGGNTLYSPTAANTNGRIDAMLNYLIATIGTDVNCYASTFDEVWVWSPLGSAVTAFSTLTYMRTGASNAVTTAAFVTACQNGDPSRVIRCFDATAMSFDNVDLVNKTTFAHIQYDNGIQPFLSAIATSSPLSADTSGANVYFPYFYSDKTHPGAGATDPLGEAFGQFYLDTR